MAGYGIDPVALDGAIKRLEDIRDSARDLVGAASRVEPGELVAGDAYTNKARQAIQDRATSDQGSLRKTAEGLQAKLEEKINAYRETLREYQAAEDAATVDGSRINRQA